MTKNEPTALKISDDEVFNNYKPFRNIVAKAQLYNSLYAVWAHANYQKIEDFSLPTDIQCPIEYRNLGKAEIPKWSYILPWELEILARELIINSRIYGGKKDYRNWDDFRAAMNKLKAFEDWLTVYGLGDDADTIFNELKRISHLQFPRQQRPNKTKLIRFWKMYKDLNEEFISAYGVDYRKFYLIVTVIFVTFTRTFSAKLDWRAYENYGVTQELFERLIHIFSMDFDLLREKLIQEQTMNSDYLYGFSSLSLYPLIKLGDSPEYICPLPYTLFNRVTDSIYYDIIKKDENYAKKIGFSFQGYIGEYLKSSTQNLVINEEEYKVGKSRKDTIDWFLLDENGDSLLIECKLGRMSLAVKKGNDFDDLNKELHKVVDFILQAFTSLRDYSEGKYPDSFPKSNKKYIAIVLFDDWYIFGDWLVKRLKELLRVEIEKQTFLPALMKDTPFMIMSVSTFECLSQLLSTDSLSDIFGQLDSDDVGALWNIDQHILDRFADKNQEMIFPFLEDYDLFIQSYKNP